MPHVVPLFGGQRHARVRADAVVSAGPRVAHETGIGGRIGENQGPTSEDDVSAERRVAGNLLCLHPDLGLQPAPVTIDQRDVCLRHAEHARRQGRDAIEALFRRSIEDAEGMQCLQSLRLVRWNARLDHHSPYVEAPDAFGGRDRE